MKNSEIKWILLWQLKNDFDINTKSDLTSLNSQSFQHQVGFQFIDEKSEWCEAWMNIQGNLYKAQTDAIDLTHFPPAGGFRQYISGEVSVIDWWFNNVEVYLNGNKPDFTISLKELSNAITQ